MKREEIKVVLEKHKRWLEESEGWSEEDRADLYGADLSRADLYGADLRGAGLRGADLSGADLRGAGLYGADLYGADLRGAGLYGADLYGADLRGADLYGADLCGAGLYGADLRGANLSRANLRGADLRGAGLYGANLRGADLRGADLSGANINKDTKIRFAIACPDAGAFIAWKAAGGYIVKMEIPEDAKRSSATTRKCRCDKAKVLEIQNKDGSTAEVSEVTSDRGGVYRVGEMVYPDSWDEDRWNECSHGIHFFVTRMEAEDWM